jgi:hypothetical protein
MANSAITGPVLSDVKRSPAGTAAAPSWSFVDSTGTGAYLVSPDVFGVSTAGLQRMVVDASGNVGIGTGSPTVKLDVNGTIRIPASTGFQLGNGSTYFYTSATSNGNLIFGTSSVDRMTLDNSGALLIGKAASSDITVGLNFYNAGAATSTLASSTNVATSWATYSTTAGAYRFYVGMGGTIFATSTTISGISDQRLKENIRDLDDGLASILELKPRKFDWKEGKGKDIKNDRGFIAQEFEQVFPDMIDTWRDPAPEGEEPYKSVNANLIPTLVKAIQEQQEIISKLEARIATLESK